MSGFLTAMVIQSIFGVYAFLATCMFGSGFLICICNYSFLVDLIQLDLNDLDEMWKGPSTTSVAFRHAYLYNICKKLQDMNRFVSVDHIKKREENHKIIGKCDCCCALCNKKL